MILVIRYSPKRAAYYDLVDIEGHIECTGELIYITTRETLLP